MALSYGTKYRKKDVAKEYLTRIEKYLAIDDSDSPQKVNEKKVDWLIENLDFESTKFDAKQELTNLFRALYRCENHDDCNKMILDVAQLTPKQRTKLTSFAKESELISYQWDSALYNPLDEYYLEQVVDRMEAAVNQKKYYTVRNYISLLKDHGDANVIATKEEEWSECLSDISNQEAMLVTAKSLAKDIRGKYNFSASDRNAYMQLVPSNYERNKVRFKEKISVLKKY